MKWSLVLSLIGAALVVSAVGCGSDVDRDAYVKANERLFHQLPVFPGARLILTDSTGYRDKESGPVVGYTTRFEFSLPTRTHPDAVASFFTRSLEPQWRLHERLDGPVLNFRKGQAQVSVNLDNWRVHMFEVAVDHSH